MNPKLPSSVQTTIFFALYIVTPFLGVTLLVGLVTSCSVGDELGRNRR